MRDTVAIDSRIGGMGDIWMRLLALYSLIPLAGLSIAEITVPRSLESMAQLLFNDRLRVVTSPSQSAIALTHLGLRHTLPAMLRGQRFIFPFFYLNEMDRKVRTAKTRLNALLIRLTALTGWVRLPHPARQKDYQALMEMTALPEFRSVSHESFADQSKRDLPMIRQRLTNLFPSQPEFGLAVFPSGSAHQAMPVEWARKYFPAARYVFFSKDDYQQVFRAEGLTVENFSSVEELFQIAARARSLLSTESFTSHVLQTYTSRVVIALTQQLKSRIVHPAFDGISISSQAPCSPCRSLARGLHPLCETGHDYCLTWNHPEYILQIQNALS